MLSAHGRTHLPSECGRVISVIASKNLGTLVNIEITGKWIHLRMVRPSWQWFLAWYFGANMQKFNITGKRHEKTIIMMDSFCPFPYPPVPVLGRHPLQCPPGLCLGRFHISFFACNLCLNSRQNVWKDPENSSTLEAAEWHAKILFRQKSRLHALHPPPMDHTEWYSQMCIGGGKVIPICFYRHLETISSWWHFQFSTNRQ